MALAELIGKLKNKRQTSERSTFSEYLRLIKRLAAGEEIDSGEAEAILRAAGRSETDLEGDVRLQEQRLHWAAQLQANRQAIADRSQAERDFLAAQQKLQRAIDELSPQVRHAENRLRSLGQIEAATLTAEARLSELILDAELLEREAAVIAELREVNAELNPLLKDRAFKLDALKNAELALFQKQRRESGAWPTAVSFFCQPKDVDELAANVADIKNQVRQLDQAIAPRQAEQRRLQAEINQIHAEKLKP